MHESATMTYLVALLIGVVAGLRSLTAPALVSWAARVGRLPLGGTWLAFLGYRWTPWIFALLAVAELVIDQLPSTPSRTAPRGFTVRIITGALSGGAVGASAGAAVGGLVAGVVGAVLGTLGGSTFRGRLAAAFHRDRPAAFIEDVIALGGGALLFTMAL
jgi:uncharacterized membrane protein